MKINLTIDATPEEVRRALGLPVMNDVHQAVMDQMRDQAISRHTDVLDRIKDSSEIIGRMREAQTLAQPYMS